MPVPACVEDYDDDASCVQSGTRQYARRRRETVATSNPPKSISRYRYTTTQDGASEGQSSRSGAVQASASSNPAPSRPSSTQAAAAAAREAMPPPLVPRPATNQPQTRSRPVIHRSESQRSRPKPPSRSSSSSRPTNMCSDPACNDPNCPGARYAARRQSGDYSQYAAQYGYGTSPSQYQQTPGYPYAYVQPPQSTPQHVVPQLAAQPRPRAMSSTRQTRPASFHAGYSVPNSYGGGTPTTSAGYTTQEIANMQYWAQMQRQQQQQQAYQNAAYGNMSSTQPLYTPQSPIQTSPTFPTTANTVAPNANFSTRMAAAATTTPSYAAADVRYAPPLGRTMSARGPQGRTSTMPGTFPTQLLSDSSESASESEESDYSSEDDRRRRSRARDSRLMSSSSQRRPSLPKSYTSAPVVPTRSTNEPLRRNPRSDNVIEYLSSSDAVDSDRTARAVVDHAHRTRTTVSNSTRSSRRPSVSTNASSGHTRLSSATSGMNSLTISSSRGDRNVEYMSKRDQDDYYYRQRRHAEAERQRQREIEDYQEDIRGGMSPELTLENIRKSQVLRQGSVSGRSQRSRRSERSRTMPGDGVEIKSGNTIINVTGDSSVSFMTSEDGARRVIIEGAATATSVISGGKGKEREKEYIGGGSGKSGSKSSASSRVGRSRGGSEVDGGSRVGRGRKRDSIQEEVEGGEE